MKDIFEYTIFRIDDYQFTSGKLFAVVAFILFLIIFLRLLRKTIKKYSKLDDSKKYSIFTLIKYFVYVFSSVIILQIIGLNITVLIAGSTALLVGLGLGLQNLFSDYISGIVILFDSSLKVGDIIDINGLVGKVQEINLRTTLVLTRDDKYILLPNTDLTRNHLINWTHQEIESRFEVSVGVDYSSDIHKVMIIMKEATQSTNGVNCNPEPFVRFNDYAESALNFTVYFWCSEVFRVENIKSEVRIKIFDSFRSQGIIIPFPQRVIHLNNKEK